MKKIILFLLIFLIPFSYAYSTINIYVDGAGQAEFLGQADSEINFPEGIYLLDGQVFGQTSELTNKAGQEWSFSLSLPDSEFQVILPKGAKILKTNGEISLLKEQIVVYATESVKIDYVIEPEENGEMGLVFFIILLIVILLIFYFLFRKRKKQKRTKETEKKYNSIKEILNERERIILDKLKETGKTKSSYLRKKTEIPKASFSRHIRELEKKGLVKFSGEGRNKFVELK